MKKLKQILSNKNTVTFIAAILIVLVLYFFYNWRVNQATSPIRIPYAKTEISSRTQITADMVDYVDIPQDALRGNVLTNFRTQILNMFVQDGSKIPAGSLFYKGIVVKEEDLKASFLKKIPDGEKPYVFDVDIKSTYGNSMRPDSYIDVYFKGVGDDGLIMLGKLVENVMVVDVQDANGNHVFETTSEERRPSQLIVAVEEDIHLLLRTIKYIRNAEVILVPTGVELKEDPEEITTAITTEEIKKYIEDQATIYGLSSEE